MYSAMAILDYDLVKRMSEMILNRLHLLEHRDGELMRVKSVQLCNDQAG
jgi:hypothetical protein